MVNAVNLYSASPRRSASVDEDWRHAAITFAAILAPLLALFFGDIADMTRIWTGVSLYHHAIFAAPVSLFLIWRRRDWKICEPYSDANGLWFIAAAIVVWLLSQASNIALIAHVAVVTGVIGAAVIAFGGALARQWAFPLAFLYFAVPFGAELTPALQTTASIAVTSMLNLAGVQTLRDGFMLTTSGGQFEMAESCAGLRFFLAGAMISSLAAFLSFSRFKSALLFILAALAVSIIANWLRASFVVALATLTHRKLGLGPEHVILGWIFYSALIVGLIWVARQNTAPEISAKGVVPVRRDNWAPAVGAIMPVAAFLYANFVVASPPRATAAPTEIAAAGWLRNDAPPSWRAEMPGADVASTSSFLKDGAAVEISAASFAYDRPGAEIAAYGVRAFDGKVWRKISSAAANIGGKKFPMDIIENASGKKLTVVRFYRYDGRIFGSAIELKLRIALDKLAGKSLPGAAIFVASADEVTIASFINDAASVRR